MTRRARGSYGLGDGEAAVGGASARGMGQLSLNLGRRYMCCMCAQARSITFNCWADTAECMSVFQTYSCTEGDAHAQAAACEPAQGCALKR